MRILVDNGCYGFRNQGDNAMLQTAILRLKELWPNAYIQVIANIAGPVDIYCPGTYPLVLAHRPEWHSSYRLFGRLYRENINTFIMRYLLFLEKKFWAFHPLWARNWIGYKKKRWLPSESWAEITNYIDGVLKADLIIASGGGYVNDIFKWLADMVLHTIEAGALLGTPVAMVGQGIGPIKDPKLKKRFGKILKNLDFIALREGKYSIQVLDDLGVGRNKILVTGDDSVKLAFDVHNTIMGDGIGINLRFASYSKLTLDYFESVRSVLHTCAKSLKSPLIPVPIEFDYDQNTQSDVMTIQKLLSGIDDSSDGGANLDSPKRLIQQLKQCRLVVAGSYHAAVFALSQGIPVVCLAQSEYYLMKFAGLAEQFGTGCEIVTLESRHFKDRLRSTIEQLWYSAERLRPQLLESADRQMNRGDMAYKRIFDIVENR